MINFWKSGSGRKGGREKENIVSRSVRPCLQQPNVDSTKPSSSSDSTCFMPNSPMAQPFMDPPPSCSSGVSVSLGSNHGQVTVASGESLTIAPVINSVSSLPSGFITSSPLTTTRGDNTKPFVIKFMTKKIKVCQSCRNNYEGANDTLGMVVARAERRLITNSLTGLQFWAKESNSHYHARLACLKMACLSFQSKDLVIPYEIKSCLTIYQKSYLFQFMDVQIV